MGIYQHFPSLQDAIKTAFEKLHLLLCQSPNKEETIPEKNLES